jgi:hypothetical protein
MGHDGEDALKDVSNKDIAKLLARLACNAITITDCLLDGIGIALFPYAAMANHACRCALDLLQLPCSSVP